ncbi:MAG: hypothetical protein M1819_003641 [Sarea resinae]|nr:MAG: hypothetical protein M1819_003641 [Sarea resinae]
MQHSFAWYGGKIRAISKNDAGMKRRVSAVSRPCDVVERLSKRWWPVLLNQDLRAEPAPIINLTDVLDDKLRIDEHMKRAYLRAARGTQNRMLQSRVPDVYATGHN